MPTTPEGDEPTPQNDPFAFFASLMEQGELRQGPEIIDLPGYYEAPPDDVLNVETQHASQLIATLTPEEAVETLLDEDFSAYAAAKALEQRGYQAQVLAASLVGTIVRIVDEAGKKIDELEISDAPIPVLSVSIDGAKPIIQPWINTVGEYDLGLDGEPDNEVIEELCDLFESGDSEVLTYVVDDLLEEENADIIHAKAAVQQVCPQADPQIVSAIIPDVRLVLKKPDGSDGKVSRLGRYETWALQITDEEGNRISVPWMKIVGD